METYGLIAFVHKNHQNFPEAKMTLVFSQLWLQIHKQRHTQRLGAV